MKIIVNGEQSEISNTNLVDCLQELNPTEPFAIALNEQFVAKSDYKRITIHEGDALEILSPMSGG